MAALGRNPRFPSYGELGGGDLPVGPTAALDPLLLSWFAGSHLRWYEREAILGRLQAAQVQIGPREESGGTGRLR
jgi:hypothetical protein